VARFLIVGGGERASALALTLEREGHVARAVAKPGRDSLEHVAIVCWLAAESPERFLLGAVDSSMRGFVYRASSWEGAVLETARRNSIPTAAFSCDEGDAEGWLERAREAIDSLVGPWSMPPE
jgi:hypothetical protein